MPSSPSEPAGGVPASGRHLRVGVQLPEVERHVAWPEYLAMARAAEEVGFDSVWVGDHLLYRGDGRETRGPWDAWSVLAALAATTARVRLGPLVACTAFAAPGLLARRAAAVHEISGGRLVLGLGAGWNEPEFRAFGVPFDHRAARFGESFEIVRRLLAGERVTYEGRFERVRDAVLLPRPAGPPPLMIGSTGERVLRIALPHADAWNVWYDLYGNTPEGFARENARVSRLALEAGRRPSDILRSATVFVALEGGGRDRPHTRDAPPLTGSPEAIACGLVDLAAAGADEAILIVSPISERSIRSLADVVAALAARRH
jgi:alkanesulfonate monooxygenase SsuD/methylene tetrahydromethanopterin reductase-like flavin-dependent oxidoreductase (luciferase family)